LDGISLDIKYCFKILELESGSSPDELKQAYRDLVNVWHPDRFFGNPRLKEKAEEKLKEVNTAYETILSHLSKNREDNPPPGPSDSRIKNGLHRDTEFFFNQNFEETVSRSFNEVNQIRPWIRLLARAFDYLLFGSLLFLAGVPQTIAGYNLSPLFYPLLLTFIWVLPEAALTSLFATTPGKLVFRSVILDSDLTKPDFLKALKRCISVWWMGMGLGILLITPFTSYVFFQNLKKEKCASWDISEGFFVIHNKIGTRNILIAIFSFCLFTGFAFYKTQDDFRTAFMAITHHGDETTTLNKNPYRDDLKDQIKQVLDNPGDAHACYRLGKSYTDHGRYSEAVELLQTAIRILPDFADAYYYLGFSYIKLQKPEEANKSLKRTIEIEPEHAEAHHILGILYLNSGDRNSALEEYKILKNLDEELAKELLKFLLES